MTNLIKSLLLSAIIFSVNNNNCKSMEYNNHSNTSNYDINNSELFNEDSKIFESDSEDKKSENSNNIINNEINTNSINNTQEKSSKILEDIINQYNSADQYKYLFDKKHNEEYLKKIRGIFLPKYKIKYDTFLHKYNTKYICNTDKILDMCSSICFYFYRENDSECMVYGYDDIPFYDRINSGRFYCLNKIGDTKVINHSELVKYAEIFDSISYNTNDGLLPNNVENLNKYISTQTEWKDNKSDDVSCLQLFQYIINNIIRLEAQILKIREKLLIDEKEDNIVIKQIINALKHVINYINNTIDMIEQKFATKDNNMNEYMLAQYMTDESPLDDILQTESDVLNKITELKNKFNVLHNKIIGNFTRIIQDINDYKMPNTFVMLCGTQGNNVNSKSPYFSYYSPYISANRYNKLTKDIILKNKIPNWVDLLCLNIHRQNINSLFLSKKISYVFLDQYLQQLVAYFNILKDNIDNQKIHNNKKSKPDLLNRLTNIINNIYYYGNIAGDVLECFGAYFIDNDRFSSLLKCSELIRIFKHRHNISNIKNYKFYDSFNIKNNTVDNS